MRKLVVWALASLTVPTGAAAEQPDWDRTADRLLVVLQHNDFYGVENYGLWEFDPDSGEWERLRHFRFNSQNVDSAWGRGCFLSAAAGVVSIQAWPANLELEAGTYRVLRRSSPVSDPAAEGWTVHGPAVGVADAALLGLESGTYGIARCLGELLPHPPWAFGVCERYALAGSGLSVGCTETAPWPLLRRDDAGRLELAGLLPPLDWYPQWADATEAVPTLSLDPERRAFWRGTPRGVELVPIEDGTVGQPTESHTFDFSPFGDPSVLLEVAYYHPRRQRLFVAARCGQLFALSEDFQPEVVYTGRTPVTLASLGEQPAAYEQLLPVLAHTPGRNGTFWTSDLWLFNPSAEATTLTLRRVAAAADTRTVDLPAHGSVRIPDALAFLGGTPSGDGSTHDALVLTAPYRWGEQVVAASRSFTAAPGGGTFGHAVTAAPGRAGYSNHLVYPGEPEPDWVYGVTYKVAFAAASTLYADRRVPGQMRHNLGVVNDFDDPVTLTLLWGHMELLQHNHPDLVASRPPGALQSVEVPPHSVWTVQLDTLFPPEVTEVWPPRVAVWGSRPVVVWFSMVDNLSGDATFVPYPSLQWGSFSPSTSRATVPVVVHAPGEAGTTWRTDLYGADTHLELYIPHAWLHPRDPGSDCGGAATTGEIARILVGEVAQPPGVWPDDDWVTWATVYPDVARAFCQCSDEEDLHAGLEVRSATWQIGWSRTYTTRDDGGTYGEMLPFYPLGGWPVQHFAGVEVGSTFRVNVGLFNGDGEHAITHRITLYAADGQVAAERTITLQPYASLQRRLEHLFRMEVGSLPAGTYGMTVLPLDDPEHGVKGRSWAYVSLVDNVTNDPTNWW